MELVGPRLDDHVGRAAGIAAGLRLGTGNKGEFADGVQRQERAGYAGGAALIYRGNIPPNVVVVGSFDLIVDLVGA